MLRLFQRKFLRNWRNSHLQLGDRDIDMRDRIVMGSVGTAKQSPSVLASTCALFVTCIRIYCIHRKVTSLKKSGTSMHLIPSFQTDRRKMMMPQVNSRIKMHVIIVTLQVRCPPGCGLV